MHAHPGRSLICACTPRPRPPLPRHVFSPAPSRMHASPSQARESVLMVGTMVDTHMHTMPFDICAHTHTHTLALLTHIGRSSSERETRGHPLPFLESPGEERGRYAGMCVRMYAACIVPQSGSGAHEELQPSPGALLPSSHSSSPASIPSPQTVSQ